MLNKRLIAIVVALMLPVMALAQGNVPKERIKVRVHTAASPAEQLRHCEDLLDTVYATEDANERTAAVLAVLANLDVVARNWPGATAAVADAALTSAEVALQFDMPRNAAVTLNGLSAAALDAEFVPVKQSLGRAYEAMGMLAEAERELLQGEKALRQRKVDVHDADKLLEALAGFYHRRNQPRESMKRLAAAARLPGQKPLRAALLHLQYVRQAVALGDDASRAEARAGVDDALAEIRRGKEKAGRDTLESDTFALLERDLTEIRSKHALH